MKTFSEAMKNGISMKNLDEDTLERVTKERNALADENNMLKYHLSIIFEKAKSCRDKTDEPIGYGYMSSQIDEILNCCQLIKEIQT